MNLKYRYSLNSAFAKNLLIYTAYVIGFIFSLKNDRYVFDHSISIDLLYRVVGSRLMEDGKSPYYDKWQPDQPNSARYYHPIPRYSQKINGVTVTPPVLEMNRSLADMDFCQAARWWFYIQVGALYLCGMLLLLSFRGWPRKFVASGAFLLFFAFSRNFYLHLHSAQVYIFYGLIFCALYAILRSNLRPKYILTGILLTIGIWLKPYFLFLFIPFFFTRNKAVFKGAAITAAILLLHAVAFNQLKYWKEYVGAMPEYSHEISIADQPDFLRICPPPPSFSVPDCVYPLKNADGLSTSSGLAPVQYYFLRLNMPISQPFVFGVAALILCVVISFAARRIKTAEQWLALLFLLYIIVELFTPAQRKGYFLMEWPAAALIVLCGFKQNRVASLLMLIGLVINNGYIPFSSVHAGSVGEGLMILGLILFVTMPYKKVPNAEVSDTTGDAMKY